MEEEKKIRQSMTFDLTQAAITWINLMSSFGLDKKEVIEKAIRYAMQSDEFNETMRICGEIKRDDKALRRNLKDRAKSARQYEKKKRGGCPS